MKFWFKLISIFKKKPKLKNPINFKINNDDFHLFI